MLGYILFLVAVGFVFFFVLIRPAQRRNRELHTMQATLEVGDEVMLTSGICGTLRETMDDHVLLDIADGVTIKVARGAVGQLLSDPTPEAAPTSQLDAVEPEEN